MRILLGLMLIGACATEMEATTSEVEAEVNGTTGWEPGGVYSGDVGQAHMECSTCTGNEACNTVCIEPNGDASTCGAAGPTCTAARVNVARSSTLATASASSTYSSGTPASTTIDGDRRGVQWAHGGGWSDASSYTYPDWVEVRFNGGAPRVISEVDVYTLQDACGMNPSASTCLEPTDAMTFANFGITNFRVQTWNGTAFVDAASITNNNKVKRRIELDSIETSRIRIAVDNSFGAFSRIIEIEAWKDTSAFDPSLTEAINTRIAMTGATGCEIYPHAVTIAGVTGYYKRCNFGWVVASPGNGAWLLPQTFISNRYLGGTTWPGTPNGIMTGMGFPKGAYHGSEADDNYMLFERGILAKSNADTLPRIIGGLGPSVIATNAMLVNAWLASKQTNKYPDTDTQFISLGANGYRFSTEANSFGYDSTFLAQVGASAAVHINGEIDNAWNAAAAATRTTLGFPITNELRIGTNGSAISHFTGGSIAWRPTTCGGNKFTAQILIGQNAPVHADNLTGVPCTEVQQVCVDGLELPFTSSDGVVGTYRFECNEHFGWHDTLRFKWTDLTGAVERTVRSPILGRYLNGQKIDYVMQSGLGRPRGEAEIVGDTTVQHFQRGDITDAAPCAAICTTTKNCGIGCTDGGHRIKCGDFTPAGFAFGKCQLFDQYCELPEITDLRVLDANEHSLDGPDGFFYYHRSNAGEKRGRMPVQLGGVGGALVSEYRTRIWEQAIPNIAEHQFPFGSNLPGPHVVIDGKLQLEFAADPQTRPPDIALPHPVLMARQCVALPQTTYGVHPPIPAFAPDTTLQVFEDDECLAGVCNPDDYIGSIRLTHGDCATLHWTANRDFGFTNLRTLSNTSPAGDPDIRSSYMDTGHYRAWCYRQLNAKSGATAAMQDWTHGIGSQQFSGFSDP